ncbi:MAG TPA: DUF1259 domain-containing protein, partial [Pyrinomonadaceae bacterium]|nr:DUF1259 domain-containing protein [Pyrinomonadaceae bacterium]
MKNNSPNVIMSRWLSSRVLRRLTLAMLLAVVTTMFVLAACSAPQTGNSNTNAGQPQAAADWKPVEQALGKAGSMQPGDVYKVSLPRSDLKVTVGGVELKPALALGSWVAFKKS